MNTLGGHFVPGQGSGCDTWLRTENGSQRTEVPADRRIVKKITGMAPKDRIEKVRFFVRKFSNHRKPWILGYSDPSRDGKWSVQKGRHGNREAVPMSGSSLARMLLPAVLVMIADFFSTMTFGRNITAAPQLVVTPRGLYTTPGFFVHDFLRESFHRSVGTQRRPHRGGKEGSVCRVM